MHVHTLDDKVLNAVEGDVLPIVAQTLEHFDGLGQQLAPCVCRDCGYFIIPFGTYPATLAPPYG